MKVKGEKEFTNQKINDRNSFRGICFTANAFFVSKFQCKIITAHISGRRNRNDN